MRKIIISILISVTCLLTVSCNKQIDFSNVVSNPDITLSDFALYSDDSEIALNADITNFKREPIKVKEGSGDGFSWREYEYYDIIVKALMTDEGGTNVVKITTSSANYKTSKGIKVGDNIELLKELYNEKLYYQENIDNGNYYLYDPEDDLGFKKIRFYAENEVIKTIELEDTIDG